MTIAIIPARGGSKRIPRKNIKLFLDKPIIAYSIEAAIKSGIFDEIMVSTDDDEIAEIAQKYGAKVPFKRSANTSNDFATTADVLKEVLASYESIGQTFENACCLYPTAPLVQAEVLQKAHQKVTIEGFDTAFPIQRFGFPIQRSLKIEDNKLQWVYPENASVRSQDLQPSFHDTGQFYFFNVASFLTFNSLLTSNSAGIEIAELEAQDIDNEVDWKLAEIKYKMLNTIYSG
jgi:pseudaminic acid cytidylyltransferase